MSKSIMQDEKHCYVCGATQGLHLHHIFYGTANRKLSDKYGCTVYLCPYHHTASKNAVHVDHNFDVGLKRVCQRKLEAEGWSREQFIKTFGRSWVYDDLEVENGKAKEKEFGKAFKEEKKAKGEQKE